MPSISTVPNAKLNTGATIPLLGFGTFTGFGEDDDTQRKVDLVSFALKSGYRHIDTASIYKCETSVGKGIKASGVPREEIFLVTKIWNNRKGDARAAIDESLARLGVSYIDLLLIHWPNAQDSNGDDTPYGTQPDFNTCWKEMSDVFREGGKVRAIGVSNFSKKTLEELFEKGGKDVVVPAVNQINLEPNLPQFEEVSWMESKGIHVTAWSPLGGRQGNNTLLTDPDITKIAEAKGCSVGQILIAWGIQRGTSTIPSSNSESRAIQNGTLVQLGESEMKLLNEKHKDPENPRRIPKGSSKTKKILGWTFEEMGWSHYED